MEGARTEVSLFVIAWTALSFRLSMAHFEQVALSTILLRADVLMLFLWTAAYGVVHVPNFELACVVYARCMVVALVWLMLPFYDVAKGAQWLLQLINGVIIFMAMWEDVRLRTHALRLAQARSPPEIVVWTLVCVLVAVHVCVVIAFALMCRVDANVVPVALLPYVWYTSDIELFGRNAVCVAFATVGMVWSFFTIRVILSRWKHAATFSA